MRPPLGVLLVLPLAVTAVVLASPSPPRSSTISAHDVSFDRTDATASTCGPLSRLLGACKTTTTTTTSSSPSGSGGAPPSTATSGSSSTTSTTTGTSSAAGAAGTPTTTTTSTTPGASAPENANATSGKACKGKAPPVAPPSGHWTCTFDDEFNGTSLDTAKWLPQLTANSAYTTGSATARPCYVNTPQTISESGGTLNLSIVHLSQPAFCTALDYFGMTTPYQAGMVSTYKLFSQQYGYFAVRAETPPTAAGGLQETFWLYPQDENLYGRWPDSGEIDFAEFYSYRANKDYPTVHYPGSHRDPNATAMPDGCAPGGATPAGQFNTYALAWTPTTLTTYFNGVPCITDTYWPHVTHPDTAPEPFNQPFFLNLTAAMGRGANTLSNDTSFPATTRIDWVRVWQYG